MNTVLPEHVARLRTRGHENSAIHVDDGIVSIYCLDHRCETSVASYGEIYWTWTDQEIADWINCRIEEA